MKRYIIKFEKTEMGFGAYAPDIPGVGVTGKTKEEAETLIYEAIQFHFEGLLSEGLPLPMSVSEAEMLLIPA